MTDGDVRSFLEAAAERRLAGLTPAQRARREELARRQALLQERGIKRGPNAPKDGTFGAKA